MYAQHSHALRPVFLVVAATISGVLVAPLPSKADLPDGVPLKRGEFAFRYHRPYTADEMDWLSRFDIVVTADILPAEQVSKLRAAGCRLVYYEWLVAFYTPAHRAPEWEFGRELLAENPQWVLNADKALYGHAGAGDIPAYYYDVAAPGLIQWRVKHLIDKARDHSYDGIFFDTTTLGSVHPDAQELFKQLHPGASYDTHVAKLLAGLKKSAPDLILFSNQGYRDHANYLPHVGYDLSESYMTTTADAPQAEVSVEGQGMTKVNETNVRRWYDPENLWQSVAHYCRVLISDPVAQFGYTAKTCHLNYGHPRYVPTGETSLADGQPQRVFRPTLDREAIHYAMACALLLGHTSYYEAQPGVPADDVYFIDMGKPMGESYKFDQERGVAWRLFDNGLVVVNDSGGQITHTFGEDASLPENARLLDVFSGQEVPRFADHRRVSVPASRYVATDRVAPTGRLFVYLR